MVSRIKNLKSIIWVSFQHGRQNKKIHKYNFQSGAIYGGIIAKTPCKIWNKCAINTKYSISKVFIDTI